MYKVLRDTHTNLYRDNLCKSHYIFDYTCIYKIRALNYLFQRAFVEKSICTETELNLSLKSIIIIYIRATSTLPSRD